MAWIKVEHSTPDKPEVHRMADILGIEPEHVVGCLLRIWIWADQQIAGSNAVSVTASLVNRLSGVSDFADALVTVGWLERTGDGIAFPNFERHNGQTAKQRALTAKRQAEFRAKSSNGRVTPGALPREEKRREEVIHPPNPPRKRGGKTRSVSITDLEWPDSLDTPEAKQALEEWIAYKRDRGQGYRATNGPQKILNEFGELGPAALRRSIDHAIASNYAGVFPVTSNGRHEPEPQIDWSHFGKGKR